MRRPFFLVWLLLAAGPCLAQPLDPQFGNGGRATVYFDEAGTVGRDQGAAVFVVPGDAILSVGSVDVADADPAVVGIGLARQLANGQPDATFTGGGKTVKNAAMTSVTDAAVGSFGKLLVTGAIGADSALVMFNSNGSLATPFAGDGGTAWDASGIGEADQPSAVLEVGGVLYVAGRADAAPGAAVDFDVWLGRVHPSTGAFTALFRDDIGGSDRFDDRVVDVEADLQPAGPAHLAMLTENDSPDYAGSVVVLDADGLPLRYITLLEAFDGEPGCVAGYADQLSTDLIPISSSTMAVVGNVLRDDGFPVQAYAIVVDVDGGQRLSVQCGPVYPSPSIVFVNRGAAAPDEAVPDELHLAVTVNGRSGYWRWAPSRSGALRYRPDDDFYAGPFGVDFATPFGNAADVAVDGLGRAIVLGTCSRSSGDDDFSLFRVHASARVFRDSFGS